MSIWSLYLKFKIGLLQKKRIVYCVLVKVVKKAQAWSDKSKIIRLEFFETKANKFFVRKYCESYFLQYIRGSSFRKNYVSCPFADANRLFVSGWKKKRKKPFKNLDVVLQAVDGSVWKTITVQYFIQITRNDGYAQIHPWRCGLRFNNNNVHFCCINDHNNI